MVNSFIFFFLIYLDDKNKTNKSLNSKLSTNGLTKFSSSKTIPLILKRSRLSEKVDCSESNENIDENKDRKDELKAPNELVQRSSSRKVGLNYYLILIIYKLILFIIFKT